jgi:hypothetical protein
MRKPGGIPSRREQLRAFGQFTKPAEETNRMHWPHSGRILSEMLSEIAKVLDAQAFG